MMIRARTLFFASVVCCLGASLCAQSGAIFTTDKSGEVVNANKYSKTAKVFLRTSGILPSGEYVFQVTNTSGTVLLSQDGIADRTVTISGGIIVDAGNHPLGSELNGKPGSASVVQLAPFAKDSSGNYKVWLTPAGAVVNGGYHGFLPADSKTDNFKVEKGKPKVTATITGTIFYDEDEDGTQDTGDRGLIGWRTELRKNGEMGLLAVTYTDENGEFFFPGLPLDGTAYDIMERAPIFGPIVDDVQTVLSDEGYVDQGAGGRWLATTPRTQTTPPVLTASVVVPKFGNVFLVKADTGTGGTSEVHDIGWWHNVHGEAQLDSCPGWQDVLNTIANPFVTNPGFTSVTPSDQARVTACLSAASSPVSLHRSSSVVFTATTFSEFSDWIVSAALGHSAFKLSRAMAAALLNVKCGGLALTATVYINQTGDENNLELVSFDEMAYKAVCLLLNHPDAADTGPTPTTPDAVAVKAAIDNCINEFGSINTGTGVVWEPSTSGGDVADPGDIY